MLPSSSVIPSDSSLGVVFSSASGYASNPSFPSVSLPFPSSSVFVPSAPTSSSFDSAHFVGLTTGDGTSLSSNPPLLQYAPSDVDMYSNSFAYGAGCMEPSYFFHQQQPPPFPAIASSSLSLPPQQHISIPRLFQQSSDQLQQPLLSPSCRQLQHLERSTYSIPGSASSNAHPAPLGPPGIHQQGHSTSVATPSSSLSTTTSASDSCSQIAHVLMCYQQGGEDPEFVRKAIESLVKKLKDKRVELDALITAITSAGKQPTCCVTIQRSLDGRLQVAGRKGVPHVVYARIWRWPNVSKTELQKLPICCVSADNQDFICINPYHYERVVSSVMGAIDMTALRLEPTSYSKGELEMDVAGEGGWQRESVGLSSSSLPSLTVSSASSVIPSSSPSSSFSDYNKHQLLLEREPIDLSRVQIPLILQYAEHWCTITYYELDTQIGDVFKARREMSQVSVDGGMDPQGERTGRLCIGALPNVHRSQASEKARMHVGKGIILRQLHDGRVTLEVLSKKPVFVRSPFLDFVKRSSYGSSVHRLSFTDHNESAQITVFDLRWAYAEMCDQTQSANAAVLAQARAVAGLPLSPSVPPQLSHDILVGSGVDEMKRTFCSVGMSFVKGWGAGYPRSSMKECPCWIEMQLHRPLQLLDQLLKGNLI